MPRRRRPRHGRGDSDELPPYNGGHRNVPFEYDVPPYPAPEEAEIPIEWHNGTSYHVPSPPYPVSPALRARIRRLHQRLLEFTEAANDRRLSRHLRSNFMRQAQELIAELEQLGVPSEGGGIISWAKKKIASVKNFFQTANKVLGHPPPAFHAWVNAHGPEKVTSIVVMREPLKAAINFVVTVITGADVKANASKAHYDDVYHLFMVINGRWRVEKNHQVEATDYRGSDNGFPASINVATASSAGLTISDLFARGMQAVGPSYWHYSADKDNCQKFIWDTLSASGLINSSNSNALHAFIIQDPLKLLEGVSETRKTLLNIFPSVANLSHQALYHLAQQYVASK